jgi:ribonuclease Z
MGRHLIPFLTTHSIKSQGYTLFETRQKLKTEYQGHGGKKLAWLKKQGVAITEGVDVPLLAFTGDTTADLLDRKVFKAKVVVVECTFLEDISDEESARKGHLNIRQLAEKSHSLEDVGAVVLCHFSKRYGNSDIAAAIKNLPLGLREKTTFLPV